MTQITVKQMAAAKRVAMNVLPLTNNKAKLQAKIAEMEAKIQSLNEQIDVQQGYVKSFAGGLTTEQLVVRNENKVFEPNTDVVQFDAEKRVYIVKGQEDDTKAPAEDLEEVNIPTPEEIAAAEKARLEAEAEATTEVEAEVPETCAAPSTQEEVENNDPFAN